jgi:hypothetical protein
MTRLLCLLALGATVASGAAHAKPPVTAGGGSMPLTDVLAVAKPYPNLLLQVKLELVRANLKRDQVICAAERFDNRWVALSGGRLAPYECKIGTRTLVVSAAQTYYDKAGHRLKPTDAALPAKAVKVQEARLKWSWK